MAAGPAARERRPGAGARRRRPGTRRCSTRAASTRSSSGTSPATRRRSSRRSAASRGSSSSRSPTPGPPNSGRDRTAAVVYAVGWTQHTVGVQFIRTAAIIQLLLGNMGRPGGGIMAMRGHASIQGSHRRPDAVQPAARLPGDADRGQVQQPGRLDHVAARGEPEGLLAQRRRVRGLAAEGVLRGQRDARERLLLRPPAPAHRRPRHVPDHDGHDRRAGEGLLPARAEPGGRLGARPAAAAGDGQPRLAGGPGPGDDRERHVLEGRAGGRDRRDRPGGVPDRGVLLPGRLARGEGGHVHPDRSGCCSGGRRRSSRPATSAPSCGSSTTSAG